MFESGCYRCEMDYDGRRQAAPVLDAGSRSALSAGRGSLRAFLVLEDCSHVSQQNELTVEGCVV